jgi:hypothetical protein
MTQIAPRKWNGKPIAMPGIVSGMPLEYYHSADVCVEPSVSSSGMRTLINRSPKHYWSESPYNPTRIERPETDALRLGRAAHHLLFGEANFQAKFAIRPRTINGVAWHGNRLECRGWLSQMNDAGLTVITPEVIKHMSGELAENPLVRAGILNGAIEQSLFAKDAATGVWMRARPDAIPNDSMDFADLKTTRSVSYNDLVRTIGEYGYHMQAGMLNLLCRALFKKPMNSFSLVFCESEPPHAVRVVSLKDADIARGEKQCLRAIATFAKCWHESKWPGPGGEQTDATYIELSEYEQKRIDDQLKHNL